MRSKESKIYLENRNWASRAGDSLSKGRKARTGCGVWGQRASSGAPGARGGRVGSKAEK